MAFGQSFLTIPVILVFHQIMDGCILPYAPYAEIGASFQQ